MQWMRFLFKFDLLFPNASESGRSTLNLRFIVIKQMFCQLHNLTKNVEGENALNIDGWKDFFMKK